MDPVSTAILTNLASDAIGKAAGWLASSVRSWVSDSSRVALLTQRLNGTLQLSLDTGTVHAFLNHRKLEDSIAANSAVVLFQEVSAHFELSEETAQHAVELIIAVIAMSDHSLSPALRHREAMSKLDTIEHGLTFVFGELLDEILAVRKSSSPADRELRLHTTLSELSHRITFLFTALGVSHETAVELERDHTIGAYLDVVQGDLTLGEAPMGGGKSLAALRWAQFATVRAILDPGAAVPLLLGARELAGADLPSLIEQRLLGVCRPRSSGVALVIDELDEIDPRQALRILTDATVVARSWPNSCAVAVSRLQTVPADYPVRRATLARLSVSEAEQLGQRLGVRWLLHDLPPAIREACELPLFAILVAVTRGKSSEQITSRAQLFRVLLGDRVPDFRYDQDLMWLAEACIDQGRVAEGSVGHERLARFRGTGIVSLASGWVTFALPVLEQWYAARSIEVGSTHLTDIASDSRRLVRWRYPIALAVSMADSSDADQLLDELAKTVPHLLPWVVREVEENWQGSKGQVMSELLATERLRCIGASLFAAYLVEPGLAELSVPQSHQPTIHASVERGWASVGLGFRRVDEDQPIVEFSQRRSVDDRQKLWPWTIWLDTIRHQHETMLRDIALPCDHSLFYAELAWSFARFVTNSTGVLHAPVAVEPVLERALHFVDLVDPSRPVGFTNGSRGQRLIVPEGQFPQLVAYLRTVAETSSMLARPWPAPDNLDSASGWIDDCWTPSTWRAMVTSITAGALEIYESVTHRWFAHLLAGFATHLSLPAEIAIRLKPSTGRGGGGHLWGELWNPLPPGGESIVSVSITSDDHQSEVDVQAHWTAWSIARGPYADLCRTSISHHVTPMHLTGDRPATVTAYRWLWQDLAELHLADRLIPDEF